MEFQMVRHLWERNDIKGAITALKKLPDHSVSKLYLLIVPDFLFLWTHFKDAVLTRDVFLIQVQADVVGVFSERMEIVTMDLFSCMLPILVGLLDSKMERYVEYSLLGLESEITYI